MNADSMDVKVNMIIEWPLNNLTIKTVRINGNRNGENVFNILERIPKFQLLFSFIHLHSIFKFRNVFHGDNSDKELQHFQ